MKKIFLLAAAIAACSPLTGMERTHVSYDVLEHKLFPYCDQQTMCNCMYVNRNWHRTATKHFKHRTLEIDIKKSLSKQTYTLTNLLKKIQTYNGPMRLTGVSPNDIPTIVAILKDKVVGIDLSIKQYAERNPILSPYHMNNLAKLTNIQELNLSNCYQIDKSFDSLPKTLKKLNLSNFRNAYYDQKYNYSKTLKTLTNLEKLHLDYNYHVIKEEINNLKSLTKLQVLVINYLEGTITKELDFLQELSQLKKLCLKQPILSFKLPLTFLKVIPKGIEILIIYKCNCMTNDMLIYLPKFTKLKTLKLISSENLNNKVTSVAFAHLPNQLKKLLLRGFSQILNTGLLFTYIPKTIKKLNLQRCCITDEEMPYLQESSNLKSLFIGCNPEITDVGLRYLPPTLKKLSLRNCAKITNAGLLSLPKTLTWLSLMYCTGISINGPHLQRLKQLSNLEYLDLSGTEFDPENSDNSNLEKLDAILPQSLKTICLIATDKLFGELLWTKTSKACEKTNTINTYMTKRGIIVRWLN